MSSSTAIPLLSKGVKFSAMNLSKKSKIASRFLDQAKYINNKIIKVLHQNCDTFSGQKSNILALVAGTHTQKTLKDFGFTFSHKQYKLAREKAVIGQFDLNPGEKKIPQSKARIPEDVVEKINSILIEQSIPSSKTIVLAQKNGQKTIKGVRMLQYKAELDSMTRSGNINLFRMATLRWLMAEFRDHFKFNDLQRKAFRKQQLDLDTDSCMNGQMTRKYFNYLSENLTHDTFYVINCLKDLLSHEELEKFQKIHLWSDSGAQFKNNGHFGVFSRWFRDVKKQHLIKIDGGIKLNLSYNFVNEKLFTSPICSEDLASYKLVAYKIFKAKDKRKDKYAPDQIQRMSAGNKLMGPPSLRIQMKRA
ncbi:hypothetical protein BB560_003243, partial [Smittium megazygosporum]